MKNSSGHKGKIKAKLALESGLVFEGFSFGALAERTGEVVFNTSMTGYQEILTDPSYKGQIVTMTYPLIGNYGVNSQDVESRGIFLEGFIVKELSRSVSNWRAKKRLDDYLKENNIIGIEGVDTRALTRHIRLQGAMKACLSTQDLKDESLIKKAKASCGLRGIDLVKEVSCSKKYSWLKQKKRKKNRFKVVVLDCGVKYNILRNLENFNCNIIVMPAKTTAEQILREKPDGLLLSNGPGDPAAVKYVIDTVRDLIDRLPIFGICLGHQVLSLSLGAKTYKLKFGHHGGNHPVKDLKTGKIAITAQNHGFCVRPQDLEKYDAEVTHINLYDGTCEGMRHKRLPLFSVQYHPEAGPGPKDANYLFGEFIEMMKNNKC